MNFTLGWYPGCIPKEKAKRDGKGYYLYVPIPKEDDWGDSLVEGEWEKHLSCMCEDQNLDPPPIQVTEDECGGPFLILQHGDGDRVFLEEDG